VIHALAPFAAMLLALAQPAPPTAPAQRPESFQVAQQDYGDWEAEVRTRIVWRANQPWFEAAICTLANPYVRIELKREVEGESGLPVALYFPTERALADHPDWENAAPISLSIGSRVFQFGSLQWRQWAPFSNYRYRDENIMLAYGRSLRVVRESEQDPWLPVSQLLIPMMDVERMRIHYRAEGVRAEGNPARTVYGHSEFDTEGLREAMRWCMDRLASDAIAVLPNDLVEGARR
jgi:hypothetical protein